jgi:hypothetical protein
MPIKYRTPGEYAAFQDMGAKVGRSRERRQDYAERENDALRKAIAERVAARKAAKAAGIKGIMTALGTVGGGIGGFLVGGPPGAVLGAAGGSALAQMMGGGEEKKQLYPSAIGPLPKRQDAITQPPAMPEPTPQAPSAMGAMPMPPADTGDYDLPPELSSTTHGLVSGTVQGEPAPQSSNYDKYLEDFYTKQRKKKFDEDFGLFDMEG